MATTSTFDNVQVFESDLESNWSNRAKENLWMHFSRMGAYEDGGSIPIIVKGEGAYIYDDRGKRYFDGISSLFAVQVGHAREEIIEAYARQAREIAYFPIWSYANPKNIELAEC
ncbi:MAG: aminotransferase class III-fold pyridoxal phosphate-dependent enzyme, partial [Actinobacteria bacterium]|nr:aminotransferase class III-fold pyridoxal phosphate-dependent enzyme [Actinomycetota bacterium]